jgi:hypothetical protein
MHISFFGSGGGRGAGMDKVSGDQCKPSLKVVSMLKEKEGINIKDLDKLC